MATIIRGFTFSFIDEFTEAVHNLDTDTLKLALFSDDVTLTTATTAYSTTNEITGTGYTAGGATMALASGFPAQDATTGVKSFRFDMASWTTATFSARAGLIYNSSRSNKSVMVLDFGAIRSVVASTFSVAFPTTLPPIIAVRG